MSDICEGYWYY